jgi:galacturonosyltransferase
MGMACRLYTIPYCVNVQGLGTAFQKKGLAKMAAVMYREALHSAKAVFFENRANAGFFCKKRILLDMIV